MRTVGPIAHSLWIPFAACCRRVEAAREEVLLGEEGKRRKSMREQGGGSGSPSLPQQQQQAPVAKGGEVAAGPASPRSQPLWLDGRAPATKRSSKPVVGAATSPLAKGGGKPAVERWHAAREELESMYAELKLMLQRTPGLTDIAAQAFLSR